MNYQQVASSNRYREEKINQTTDMIDQIDAEQRFPWGSMILAVICGTYLLNPFAGFDLVPDFLPIIGNLDDASAAFLLFRSLAKIGWISIGK